MDKQENNQNIINIPLPPPFNLQPPKLDDHSYSFYYQRKNLMLINGQSQFSSQKDQISVKHKDKFQNSQKNSTETQSNGQAYINITLYGLCERCNNWIQKKQKETHLTFHAAIILDNLFLGDKFSSQSRKQLLQRLKVTHVVNAATQIKNYFQNEGIIYLKLDLFDDLSEDVIPQCLKAAQFIKKAHDEGGNVFVHCAMGKSRSVSAILMYLIMYHKMTLQESLSLVKTKRPIARPNLSYMKQLKQFQQKTIGNKQKSYLIRRRNCKYQTINRVIILSIYNQFKQFFSQVYMQNIQKPTILKLNIFGNLHTISCDSTFDIETLNEFCTIENVKICEDYIAANVISMEKPYSQMLKKIHGVMVK